MERGRQGRGQAPSPSAPPPVAISPRSSTWGYPGEEPGTAAHRLHPGYGCSPDIRPGTDPAPRKGAEEERRRRGRGGGAGRSVRVSPCEGAGWEGVPAEVYGYPCEGRGQGGGRRQKCTDTPAKGACGAGTAGRSVWVSASEGRVRGGDCRQKCTGIPVKARAGWGLPAEVHGYPCEGAGGAGVPAEAYGYPCEGAGGVGVSAEVYGYPSTKPARWGVWCRRGRTPLP